MSSAVGNSSLIGGSPSNKSSNGSSDTPVQHNGNGKPANENFKNGASNHWSQKKHDSCISSHCIENSNFLQKIRGGSDSGQFIYLDSCFVTTSSNIPIDKNQPDSSLVVKMLSGKLLPGEIILEIQGKKISGFTLYDVISWLKQLAKNYQSITLRTVKSSSFTDLSNNSNNINSSTSSNSSCSSTQSQSKLLLPYELRQYLDERFQKGSIDYDLQQVIRENVYMRTVPCTTRLPRQGEIHGQDYIFLTNEEFLEMEQNGDLLEYGVYNGHYYGTPKPPKEPKYSNQNGTNNNNNNNNNAAQQLHNQQSLTDMTSMLNLKRSSLIEDNETNEVNANVEISNTTAHQLFNQNLAENSELIPYGWEKVEDPEYGTFYIDHINKQTTYENPFMQQQLLTSSMKTFKPANTTSSTQNLNSNNSNQYSNNNQHSLDHNEIKTPSNNLQMQLPFNSSNRRNIFFTQNPNELKGDFFKTSLLKTAHGFGFTIIGANETSEDFLQIKFVVPDGAADRDGCLRQGDVLVYVNNECVLGYTHQDVVEIFQSIPVGNSVDLTVCRGYPLSIDPNDPNIEMVPLAAINNPNSTPAPIAASDELTASSINNSKLHNNLHFNQQKMLDENEADNEYYCEEYEEMYAAIVKGPQGFGFTIADDPQMNHQKVKQILDRDRCINLLENDVLLEINGVQLKNFNHNQVVEVLKECTKGKETIIKLKRRKYSISLPSKNSVSNLIGMSNGNGDSINGYSPSAHQFNINGKANGIKHAQSPTTEKNGDFRPISSLAKPNGHIFNTQVSQKHLQRENNQSTTQFNVNSNSANSNQVAFNYERRSKTPNILQSSSQANNSQSTFGNQTMPNKQPTVNGNINTQYNSSYQPQLRSKTPTTDRQLFQHSLPNNNQFDGTYNNDYIYLNSTNANQINAVNKKTQNQHNLLDTLYSTVNKSTRTPVNTDECDFVENTANQETIENNIKEHMPIYDSTTNIQHQRVQQNLNRFNNHQQQQQQIQQQQQQQFQQQPYNIGLRSKTPGPDICYFRETNTSNQAKQSTSQYFNQTINNNIPIQKISNLHNQQNLRSKTPTADMMYHQSNNTNSLLKRGVTTNGISSNFDNIYQPFGNNNGHNNDTNSYGEYNMEELNFINAQGGMSSRQTPCENQVITSDVDGNNYIEATIELFRQESGFGFRIVGGEEEGSQVAVGFIVQGGSAHVDGRLRPGDEIIMIDNECVLGATHRRVVQLMTIAGLNRKVLLMIRRRIMNGVGHQLPSVSSTNSTQRFAPNNSSDRSRQLSINPINNAQPYPYNITLFRNGSEGFGFVIISSPSKNGPTIGKIVENSPAERCKRLSIGDRILAVNSINIIHMNHIEIVKLIKESGNSITLTIGHPLSSTPQQIADPDNFIMQSNDNMINGYPSKSNLIDFSNSNPNRLSGRLQQQQFLSPQQQQPSTKAIINQNEYHVIELRKQFQGGFGFSIRGGKEFHIPLYVLKLADMGPAMLDGRLQVGDQILEINSSDAYQMTHGDAIERIKAGGNAVTLLIRRTGMPPPSITDIIAANATAVVSNAQQQQMPINSSATVLQQQNSTNNLANSDVLLQQQLRSKSPYLIHQNSYNDNNNRHVQQQFKNFSSSSSIINRNY